RLRLSGLADELPAVRAERDRLDADVRARMAQEEQLRAQIHAIEERASQERDQAEQQGRVWLAELQATQMRLERDLPPLREQAQRLQEQVKTLVRERDDALQQLETLGSDRDRLTVLLEHAQAAASEAARHQAEAQRLARTIEQERVQLTAMSQRKEELAARARGLEAELNQMRRDRELEAREARKSQEALRRDLATAGAEATAAKARAAAAAATRAELEGRLAELEDRLRKADEQSQRLQDQLQAQREQAAARPPEAEPEPALAEVDRLRITELTADLDAARAANERLRSLLNVFGLVDHLESVAGLPHERTTTPVPLPGRQQPHGPAADSGPR
ncbi:MAG TPA: hypothetical protein VFF52_20425, partial [Isosphaeraceae bacterium]|nr:hypothetical protein [Isosphaeraceae bacterium]